MRSPRTPLGSLDKTAVNRGQFDLGSSDGRLTRSAARIRGPKATSSASTEPSTPIVLETNNTQHLGSRKKRVSVGRWEKWERMAFLKGLRHHGRGHWKLISTGIPTRNTIQVKTHAQVVLKKYDDGFNIFEELDDHLQEQAESRHTMEKAIRIERQDSDKKKSGKPRNGPTATYAVQKMTPSIPRREPVLPARNMISLSSPAGSASFSTTATTTNMTMAASFGGPRGKVDLTSITSVRQHQPALRARDPASATSMVSQAAGTAAFSPRFFRFFPASFEESRHRVGVLSSELQQQHQTPDAYAAAGALLGLSGIQFSL